MEDRRRNGGRICLPPNDLIRRPRSWPDKGNVDSVVARLKSLTCNYYPWLPGKPPPSIRALAVPHQRSPRDRLFVYNLTCGQVLRDPKPAFTAGHGAGSVITTFLSPVLYLAAMGAGLGTLVDDGAGRSAVAGFSYLAFLAPGLLAATTMQAGANDGSWPVMAGIRWAKTYEATLSTPIAVRDLVYGHLLWAATRGGFVALVFASVMALFGAVSLDRALLAVLPALLTGIAFTAPTMAYTATLRDVQGLISLIRFGVIPMFLFFGHLFSRDPAAGMDPADRIRDALVARRRTDPRRRPRYRDQLAAVGPYWIPGGLVRHRCDAGRASPR